MLMKTLKLEEWKGSD